MEEDLSSGACVYVKKGEARSLKAGGPWIYDNEAGRIEGAVRDGDIVAVRDFDGYFLGWGFYNGKSKIRIRMLARREESRITPQFFRERIEAAWEYRKAVMREEDLETSRIIFGEADWLPGITVDRFGDVLVIESLALGSDRFKEELLSLLVETMARDGAAVRGIYERSDAKVRELEGLTRTKGFIGPEFDTRVSVTENGIRYIVDVKDGQKTGFFLDQKYNRRAVAGLCRGKRVLDCFTHTGSFGLNAAAAGASYVLSVDASETAIEQAKENARLSGLADKVEYRCADVFELLPALEQAGERFDVVILDPPAFTKSRQATKNAVRGYREINLRGMKLLEDGGFLATCSCSHFMEPELFARTIAEAARGAHRRLRQIESRTQGPDHPYLWGDAQTLYLKFLLFQVVKER